MGIVADQLLGEAPLRPHPVAVFGATMHALERACYADRRRAGVLYAATGAALGCAAGAVVGSRAAATYVAVAGRALREAAGAVAVPLAAGDLAAARQRLPALVGRDPSGLDGPEIARAVVESLADNTVDAVVAPTVWAVVGGAPGALGYRAVNTLDAMVGHRSERHRNFGWASARLDDVAGWVPARLTAALVAAVRPDRAAAVWRVVRADAPAHPSPNAGVAEAAWAAALGVRLGGTNRYGGRVEVRAPLGAGPPPAVADIARAAALSRDVTCALAALLVAPAAAGGLRRLTRAHRSGGRG
jgi:adenosylcobinamide-phosphate synthase